MMKLTEWNRSLKFAEQIADGLRADGVNAKVRSYTSYDDKKGIKIQLFDAQGNYYCERGTGIHDNAKDMEAELRAISCYIRRELV